MPNGIERHLFKVEHVVGAFHAKYGVWPTRLRLHPIVFGTLKGALLTASGLAKLDQKLEVLVEDDVGIIADDEGGRQIDIRTSELTIETAQQAHEWLELEATDLLPVPE